MNEATIEATNHPISHPEQPTTKTSPQVTAPPPAHRPESGTSQVWYSPKAFADAGYTVPTTWQELLDLSDKIAASVGVGPAALQPWA